MIDVSSRFDPTSRVLTTRLNGTVTENDVAQWVSGLAAAVATVPMGGSFKLLFDLSAYEPASLEAHKAMRNVIPHLLADHGLRPAYIDLFDDRPEVTVAANPRARCVAMVNVHHNAERMQDYHHRAGKPDQRFTADLDEAALWISRLPT